MSATDQDLARRCAEWLAAPVEGHGLWARYLEARALVVDLTGLGNECATCGEEDGWQLGGECPNSLRPCGHHCNCSWVHDCCHWCGGEYADGPDGDTVWLSAADLRRARLRAVLAEHGRVPLDDLDQVLDELETAIAGVAS